MTTSHELNLLELIVARYQRLVRAHGLLPTRDDADLFFRLRDAHELEPLHLHNMSMAPDLDLVIAVGDIDLHYCSDSRRIKDGFHSNFAVNTHRLGG